MNKKFAPIISGILISTGMAIVMTFVMVGLATSFSSEFLGLFFKSLGLAIIVSIPTGLILSKLVDKFVNLITE